MWINNIIIVYRLSGEFMPRYKIYGIIFLHLGFLVLLYFGFRAFFSPHYLIGEYTLVPIRSIRTWIEKNGKVEIETTVIDVSVAGNYIVGLRVPVYRYNCQNGALSKTRVIKSRRYFILNAKAGSSIEFTSKSAFENKLVELKIQKNVDLDYSAFDTSFKHFTENITPGASFEYCLPVTR